MGIAEKGIECRHINETPEIYLTDEEIIIKPELCAKEPQGEVAEPVKGIYPEGETTAITSEKKPEKYAEEKYSKINLKLNVPVGQISTIARIANYLSSKFNQCGVVITIHADNGTINITEYEDRVKEALKQGDIEIEEENIV